MIPITRATSAASNSDTSTVNSLNNLLGLGGLVQQQDNDEDAIESLKQQYMQGGAGIPLANSGGDTKRQFPISKVIGGIMPIMWNLEGSDLIMSLGEAEKNQKAKENYEINSSLTGDYEHSNVGNPLGGGQVTGLSTEESMLNKEAIDEKIKNESNNRESFKTFVREVPTIAKRLTYDIFSMRKNLRDTIPYEQDKADFDSMLGTLVEAKELLDNNLITQKDYDEIYNEFKDFVSPIIEKSLYSQRDNAVEKGIEDLIKDASKDNEYEKRLDEIDPDRAIERMADKEGGSVRMNDGIIKIMAKVSESLNTTKSGDFDKGIYSSIYKVASSRLQRYENSFHYTGAIMRKILARAGGDPKNIKGRDYEIYQECLRELQVYDTFVENLGNTLAKLPKLKDPDTGILVVPEIINGESLHDLMFEGTDNILTKNSDWGYSLFFDKHISDIDVLENMTQSISFDYHLAHPFESFLTSAGTLIGYPIRGYTIGTVAGGNLTELWQRVGGNLGGGLYNAATVGSETMGLTYSSIDQDFTNINIINTQSSQTKQNIQEFSAGVMEYLPEIGGGLAEISIGGGISNAAKATNTFKVLRTEGLPRLLSQAYRLAANPKTKKVAGLWQNFKRALGNIPKVADEIVTNGGVKVIEGGKVVTESLDDIKATQRLANNLIYDLGLIEGGMDAFYNARFADADLEQGSEVSLIWDLGGTVGGTILPWLYRTGLFADSKLITRTIFGGDVDAAIKQWGEGGAFNLIKLTEKSENNPLNIMAKAQFGLNSSKLASLEELQQMGGVIKDVLGAFTKVYRILKPGEKNITDEAVKQMLGLYVNQIFGADSQMARQVWNLVADSRANPADIYKYTLRLRGANLEIGPWRSSIALADSTKGKFVNFYDTSLDLLPEFREGGFSRGLREGFTDSELKALKNDGREWAVKENFKQNKDGRYVFTADGLDAASKDIDAMSMDIPIISKVSDTSESFDKLMRNNNVKRISNETLTEVTASGAYDTLSNALGEIEWICKLNKV